MDEESEPGFGHHWAGPAGVPEKVEGLSWEVLEMMVAECEVVTGVVWGAKAEPELVCSLLQPSFGTIHKSTTDSLKSDLYLLIFKRN